VPVAGAALALAVGGAGPRAVLGVEAAAHALAAAGCCAAAAALARRDWLFRAWALYALSHALPAARRLVLGTSLWTPTAGPFGTAFDAGYIVAVNGARVAGSILFVLAFARAGLAAAVPARGRAANAIAAGAVLAVGIPTLATYLDATLAAAPGLAFWGGVAIAADTVCFVLVVPLARIAGAFRGGSLSPPWAFLAAANLGWLVFDASRTASRVLGFGDAARAAGGAIVVAACLCALAAGLSHRSAISAAGAAGASPADPA
jgi:hypothetical protein